MLDYKAIGRRISFYRKQNYLTQSIMAEKMGISEGYLSQIECGAAKVSLPRLNQIAEILKIDISLLVSDSNNSQDSYCNTEILEIIKNWTPDQKTILLNLLICADEQFNS